MPMPKSLKDLKENLATEVRRAKLVGASIAVLYEDQLHEAATGLLNINTRVAATTDSLFHIGSISKVYTATLAMQLAEKYPIGRAEPTVLLDLDAPVTRYIPELQLAGQPAPDTITAREIMRHSSGLAGGSIQYPNGTMDSGVGDDCIKKWVDMCVDVPFNFQPGEKYGYSNAAYVILGGIIERLHNKVFSDVLEQYLLEPLGAEYTQSRPEEILKFRAAAGHVFDQRTRHFGIAPNLFHPRGTLPMGCRLMASARDLITFSEMHLDNGLSKSGEHILSPEAVAEMRKSQIDSQGSDPTFERWGLGWGLFNWAGLEGFGHFGGSPGQFSALLVSETPRFALAVLTNGGNSMALKERLVNPIFKEIFSVEPPSPSEEMQADFADFVGEYTAQEEPLA